MVDACLGVEFVMFGLFEDRKKREARRLLLLCQNRQFDIKAEAVQSLPDVLPQVRQSVDVKSLAAMENTQLPPHATAVAPQPAALSA